MPKLTNCAIAAILLLTACTSTTKTEIEEASFWNKSFIDSSYNILYSTHDTAGALHYFDSALIKAGNKSVYPKAARFTLLANYHYFFTGDDKATAANIDSTLALLRTGENLDHYTRTYISGLLFGGNIAYRLHQYKKANEYYFEAKNLGDEHLSPCEKTAYNYNIAMVLYRQQNFREALKYFRQAYALQQTCAPQTTAIILQQQEIQSNIGLCLIQLKKYKKALNHFDIALLIANKHKDSLGTKTMDKIYGVIDGNKAQVAFAKNKLNEAEKLAINSIALNDREGYEVEHAMTIKLLLAKIYSRKKDFVKMHAVLKNMEMQVQNANTKNKLEWMHLSAAYYEETDQPRQAIQYHKDYFALDDIYEAEQKELMEADVAWQLKDKEQDLQITKLKNDKEHAVLSLWVTVVVSSMAILFIFMIYQFYRRSKKNLAELKVLNEEIEKQKNAREEEAKQRHKLITEAVIEAQEKERSVIGLELHDNINQVLTTVKLHNEMVLDGTGDSKIVLPKTLVYLQNCINEIRSLSKRLSAPTLGKISLEESVKDLIDSINATSKVKITHQVKGENNGVLRKDLHLGVYRILQEQLNNVLKHAEASDVLVQLEHKHDRLQFSIIDNGKGFTTHTNKTGIGLVNMQTRAESLNGTFEVESKPGEGCRVKVELPYNK